MVKQYLVPSWVRVRREEFGLLFYDTRDTKLTYARSGDLLVPPSFAGRAERRLGVAGNSDASSQAVARLLEKLRAKGLLVADEIAAAALVSLPSRPVAPPEEEPRGGLGGGGGRGVGGGMGARPGSGVSLTTSRLRAPVNVTWEITEACNLSCRHCLSADLRARRAGELDYEQCRALIDELARMEVFQINFGGGEPFLRDDFLDVLRYAQGKGITTCVSTNGTVLTERLVDELLAMDQLYLQVSLDGARPETNDAIRGAGTFRRIMAGIELLAAKGFPDYSLNMVVTRVNFDEIRELRELARSLGAKTRLSRFRPSGGGCGTWEDFRLTKTQLRGLSEYLGGHPEILTGDSFFSLAPESRRALGLNMCGAAKMTLAIAPEGSVYPCAFLSDPAFLAGHALQRPLLDIFAGSPVLEGLRELEVESCRTCDRFSVCHGGCPAVAYFLTSSVGLPDPECLREAVALQEVS